jgi:hypothetical protein
LEKSSVKKELFQKKISQKTVTQLFNSSSAFLTTSPDQFGHVVAAQKVMLVLQEESIEKVLRVHHVGVVLIVCSLEPEQVLQRRKHGVVVHLDESRHHVERLGGPLVVGQIKRRSGVLSELLHMNELF